MQPPSQPQQSMMEPPSITAAHARLQQQIEYFAEHISFPCAVVARQLQDAARHLQHQCGNLGRVHVLFESLPQGVIEARSSDASALTVIFSPSVAFDRPAGIHGGAQLVESLRSFADGTTVQPIEAAGRQDLPVMRQLQEPRENPHPYAHETLAWYPGEKCHTERREWLTERVQVKEDTLAKFRHLDRKQTEGMYQKLFSKMYRIMKPRTSYEKGPLRYSRFTPPWLRKHIAIGNITILLDSDTMPELRHQRNRMGEKRLKAMMSAFYEKEALARGVLKDLLSKVPPPPPLPVLPPPPPLPESHAAAAEPTTVPRPTSVPRQASVERPAAAPATAPAPTSMQETTPASTPAPMSTPAPTPLSTPAPTPAPARPASSTASPTPEPSPSPAATPAPTT